MRVERHKTRNELSRFAAWISALWIGFYLSLPCGLFSARAAEPAPIWREDRQPAGISWQAAREYEWLQLSVAGPFGAAFRGRYLASEPAFFDLTDSWGRPLPDGRYNYEIRLSPLISDELRARLDEARQAEDLIELHALREAAGLDEESLVRRGSFSIEGGRLAPDRQSGLAGQSAPDWVWNEDAGGDLQALHSSGRTPFEIESQAATGSLYIADAGVGIGTTAPERRLHLKSSDTPAIRLEQTDTGGLPPQIWDLGFDMAGNEQGFFLFDASNFQFPFRVRPGAPSSSLEVDGSGRVGLGTDAPEFQFHLLGTDIEAGQANSVQAVIENGEAVVAAGRDLLSLRNNGPSRMTFTHSGTGLPQGNPPIPSHFWALGQSFDFSQFEVSFAGDDPEAVQLWLTSDGHLQAASKLSAPDIDATAALFLQGVDVTTLFAPQARLLNVDTCLSGGGDLMEDRTFGLDFGCSPTWTGLHTFEAGLHSMQPVGIGTTSPEALAHIQTSALSSNFLILEGDRNVQDTEVGILFKDRSALVGGQEVARIYSQRQGTSGDFDLVFHGGSQAAGGLGPEALRIKGETGNIGIGTSSPAGRLEIEGAGNQTIHFDDTAGSNLWFIGTGNSPSVDRFVTSVSGTNGAEFQIFSDGVDYQNTRVQVGTNVQLHSNGTSFFSGGNVGIGTASPTRRLTVDDAQRQVELSSSGTPRLRLSGTGNIADFSTLPDAGSASRFRFFRDTDTTGAKKVEFMKGDNSSTVHAQIGVDGQDSFFQIGGGNVGIGSASPNLLLDMHAPGDPVFGIYNTDTASNTNTATLRFTLNSTSQERQFLQIRATSSVAADAARTSTVQFFTNDAGSFLSALTLNGQDADFENGSVEAAGGYTENGSDTLSNNISGNAATATALAADPPACPVGQAVQDIDASGNPSCVEAGGGGSSFDINALTATAPTAPDAFAFYDTFTQSHRKVSLDNLGGNISPFIDPQPFLLEGDDIDIAFNGLEATVHLEEEIDVDEVVISRNDSSTSPQMVIDQNGSGDAAALFSAGSNWTIGVDNSSGDAFKICPGQTSLSNCVPALRFWSFEPDGDQHWPSGKIRVDDSAHFDVDGTTSFTKFDANLSHQFNISNANKLTVTTSGIAAQIPDGGSGVPVYIDGTGQLFENTSSSRFKTNIQDAHLKSGAIYSLQPRLYQRKGTMAWEFGYVAEEVAQVLPEFVSYDADGQSPRGVKMAEMVMLLVEEVKKLRAEVDELKGRSATFEIPRQQRNRREQ